MNQIVNIFRKDTRHHWGEIVLCQAALVAFVWNEVHGWKAHGMAYGMGRFWPVAIDALLPLAWWILIVRVVQSESLVGDRQFWTTRPYEWKKLLAAKILFVLLFINIPLLGAQLFFLLKAGFTAAPSLPGLLWMQLLLIQVPLLPIAALAAVTRNMAQATLAVLLVVLFVAGMLALDSIVEESAMSSTDASDWVQSLVLVIACVMTIWLQYAQRKAGRARLFLALGAAAILVVFVVTPYFARGEREYPLLPDGGKVPFHAALYPVKPEPPKDAPDKDEEVEIEIPIVTSGLPDGTLAQVKAVKVSVESADGFRWESNWQSAYGLLLPGQNTWTQNFKLGYKIFQRLNPVPVKARFSVAVTIFRDQDVRQIAAGNGEFAVPQVGRCWIDPKDSSDVHCHAPLVKPATLLVRTESAASTCRVPDDEAPATANSTAYAWEWNGDSELADYGISPVESFTLYLSSHDRDLRIARVCPGTPLNISFPKVLQRTRADFEIGELKLNDYRKGPFRFEFARGVTIRTKARSK
jgi:hypothetical protein